MLMNISNCSGRAILGREINASFCLKIISLRIQLIAHMSGYV